MKMDMITVAEMIKILSQENENSLVYVCGGQGSDGDWGVFGVAEDETDALWDAGTIILEYKN